MKKPTAASKKYGQANTYEPVWIAWFDDLGRLQVERFTPIWANERKVRFVGGMDMFKHKQTINRTPRIAKTRVEALKALLASHRGSCEQHRMAMNDEADLIELIEDELALGGH